MAHTRMAVPMGLAMGAMAPLMAHGMAAGAGLVFVLAHVAVVLALAATALLVPGLRARIAAHRPSRAMLGRMALGAVAGFAAVCIHCLITWHGSATWT